MICTGNSQLFHILIAPVLELQANLPRPSPDSCETKGNSFRPDICYLHPMKRLYTIVQSFKAQSAAGEAHEFKTGEAVWCDQEQSSDLLKFDADARFEWFVDRQTFEECCALMKATSTKPS